MSYSTYYIQHLVNIQQLFTTFPSHFFIFQHIQDIYSQDIENSISREINFLKSTDIEWSQDDLRLRYIQLINRLIQKDCEIPPCLYK